MICDLDQTISKHCSAEWCSRKFFSDNYAQFLHRRTQRKCRAMGRNRRLMWTMSLIDSFQVPLPPFELGYHVFILPRVIQIFSYLCKNIHSSCSNVIQSRETSPLWRFESSQNSPKRALREWFVAHFTAKLYVKYVAVFSSEYCMWYSLTPWVEKMKLIVVIREP